MSYNTSKSLNQLVSQVLDTAQQEQLSEHVEFLELDAEWAKFTEQYPARLAAVIHAFHDINHQGFTVVQQSDSRYLFQYKMTWEFEHSLDVYLPLYYNNSIKNALCVLEAAVEREYVRLVSKSCREARFAAAMGKLTADEISLLGL
jgi:hypothetical protein